MPRAVFDTNVFVSAYAFGGKPAELMKAVIRGEIALLTSPAILAELARVLADKLGFDRNHVEAVIAQIARVADIVRPVERLDVLADDPDNRVLECAVAGESGWIVTGDPHLPGLGAFQTIVVLSPAQASSRLAG